MKKGGSNNKVSLRWRDLKVIWKLEEWGRSFEDCFVWEIGNGQSLKLWEDKWVGNEALKSKFPRLFSLSDSKEASLDCCGTRVNNGWE